MWFDQTEAQQELYGWLEKALKEKHQDETSLNEAKRQSLEASLKKIEQRLSAIYDDKIDGAITAEFYEQKKSTYTAEQANIKEELQRLGQDKSAHYLAGLKLYELVFKAKAIYRSPKATNEDRRLLLSYIFSNLELLNGKLAPKYTESFDFLLHWIPTEIPIFEPQYFGEDKEKTGSFEPAFPNVCTR